MKKSLVFIALLLIVASCEKKEEPKEITKFDFSFENMCFFLSGKNGGLKIKDSAMIFGLPIDSSRKESLVLIIDQRKGDTGSYIALSYEGESQEFIMDRSGRIKETRGDYYIYLHGEDSLHIYSQYQLAFASVQDFWQNILNHVDSLQLK